MDERPPSPSPRIDEEPRHRHHVRRRRESPRPVHSSGASRHMGRPKDADRGRDRLRERGRDKDRAGRHDRGQVRKRTSARKLAAQQAPLQMAMMQGMMMHPMQMAMMGMMPPPYLSAMQRPPGPPQAPRRYRADGTRRKRRRKQSRCEEDGGASSSSSSDSSESESSPEGDGVMNPAAAMAAMAAMWPAAAAAAAGTNEPTVEAFLSSCPIDPEAANRMRALPPAMQQSVIRRGPIADTRNPSAVLIARVRDAETGRTAESSANDMDRANALADERGAKPARRSAKVTIEGMIRDYRLSPGCAWMLRALPPDKQKLAARIDPSGQADPSGYVAEQLKRIV